MANHVSAEKRDRQRIARTARNKSIKSAVRSQVKKARTAADTNGADAKTLVTAAISVLDRAVAKGVVHKKTASRRKARLAKAAAKSAAK